MNRAAKRVLTWTLVATLGLGAVALGISLVAGHGAAQARALVHCPMHPTYVSDHPGDCPICGMRLVPFDAPAPAPAAAERPVAVPAGAAGSYTCSMCPEVVALEPGRCPKCGMDLVPIPEAKGGGSALPGLAVVTVSEEGRRQAGIQTAAAEERRLQRTIRTFGTVVADETRVRHVHTKVPGWVESLQVNFTGQQVRRGQPILALYSQELLSSQQEYLQALEASRALGGGVARPGASALLRASRRRLELLDVPAEAVAELERTGTPQRAVVLRSPIHGTVTAKGVFEGQQVEPGLELLTITDLSRVWIRAALYEGDAALVQVGQRATFRLPYDPRLALEAAVSFIEPGLDPGSRTLGVRFELDNRAGALKPGMFVDVLLELPAEQGLAIPESAILDTGLRRLVYVELPGGRFAPREVEVGLRSGGLARVLSGLQAGERVAIHGNFLLDSEARIQGALAGRPDPHAGHAAEAPP
ncbi:MAG TPA: efflux RND transporter periplasmic adaptor subunit [Myxococcota bacterium]|nr:efflux RND transporter periplasmic adaptor subunit [Myxococcota bacterium]HRY95371.1 efflux RND transporter periplasmic adaptor subunit [Myxococcota bacterium]HSA21644.1 efflux RND transporter periplasmic adaptor subunit [Myxococcota bacterium]